MPRFASLAMYAAPPPVTAATDAMWSHLARALREAGLPGVPDRLDTELAHAAAWTRPDLLLAQTCGYPYVAALRGRVRLVATPSYAYPGCEGPRMRSFVVVREDATFSALADLHGAVAALNARDSNSGMNLFRAAIAPLAGGNPFFSRVVETGSHARSLAAIRAGEADVAAIDCVTFGNFARHGPEMVAGLRILAPTPSSPGLPLITAASTDDAELAALRSALARLAADPAAAPIRATLGLTGFTVLEDADYDTLAALEQEAIELGYPELR